MKIAIKKVIWLTLFSIAMGFLETAVVVYLRKLYYPNGFNFPLIPISPDIALTEFLRELATMIMLVGIGILAGKNKTERFAIFIFCFGIWDIFYYVFLKLLLDWPASMITWDILFLIPVPWVGPVIAPIILSTSMIIFALIVLFSDRKEEMKIKLREWTLFLSGSVIVIYSFIEDYIRYISQNNSQDKMWTLSNNKEMFNDIAAYIPSHFGWMIFVCGELIIIAGIILHLKNHREHIETLKDH